MLNDSGVTERGDRVEREWLAPYLDRMEALSAQWFRYLHARIGEADGVSPSQFYLLSTLEREGALTVSDLAQHLGTSVPGATGLIDRLERAGLVSRTRSKEDRRVVLVALSEAGASRLAESRALRRRVLAECFSVLTPDEVRQLIAIYEKLVSGIPAETAPVKENG